MNIMKIATIILAATVLLAWTTGCKKADQQNVVDTTNSANTVDEWRDYKTEQETRIAANDKIISDYKARMTDSKGKLSADYDKNIEALDLKNKELKLKLGGYKDQGTEFWLKFKSEFQRDTEGLGTELKNFANTEKQ